LVLRLERAPFFHRTDRMYAAMTMNMPADSILDVGFLSPHVGALH
jgi:hypothetical protein